jgi:hypothetical protein
MNSKTAMRQWLDQTTMDQKRILAKAAKTSVLHLRHIGAGRRNVSAELAQRLSVGSRALKDKTLLLSQTDLCRECAACPLL